MAKPYKTSKRRREAALRRYDQIREEQGKDPLDRNPVPSTFCHGCRWLQDRCVRPEGPCSFNPVGPSEECLYRYKNQRCPYFRRACRMRACDCPYWPHESFKCQHCGTMVPHQETAFALNRTSGLTEVKKRGYGPNRPSMVFCRQCLTGLQQSDDQTIEILGKLVDPCFTPRKTPEQRKADKRDYMREYMRRRRHNGDS